jgi:hypothetical protein
VLLPQPAGLVQLVLRTSTRRMMEQTASSEVMAMLIRSADTVAESCTFLNDRAPTAMLQMGTFKRRRTVERPLQTIDVASVARYQ